MRSSSSILAAGLAFLLAVGPMSAQSSEGGSASDFEIRIVDGVATSFAAGSRLAKGFTIQVIDGSGAPVADAAVVLRLPDNGPTGLFADGSHSAVAYTDSAGKAHVPDVQWGSESGAFTIKVTASKGVVHAGTLVEESIAPSGSAPVAPKSVPVQAAVVAPAAMAPEPPQLPAPVEGNALAAPPPSPGVPATSSSPLPSPRIAPASEVNPSVTVTNNLKGEKVHSGSGKTKWIIIAAVAAGAGVGVAMMGGHGKKAAPAANPGITIGAPTVSVGAP